MCRVFIIVSLAVLVGRAEQTSFLNSPGYIGSPTPQHAVESRKFQGISSLAVSSGGRLWATWYAGIIPSEDQNNYVVLATSGDDGKSWKEVLVVDPDGPGPVRAFDSEIWMAPDGNLYLFWAQAVDHDGTIAGVWTLKITNPEKEEPEYEGPRRLTDGVMMCKPMVLSSGEWVLPASTWGRTDFSARMVVSSDQGKTWAVRGACNVPKGVREADEHIIVERKDGSLWMLVRTSYGIGESVSADRGVTWSELTPSDIPHPGARFFIRRLASGNLLLVKHGPMDQRTGRSHLTAFISTDDGNSWTGGLLLDERNGVSYPDGQQAADGTIYITYDYNRFSDRHILFARFREEDAAAGKKVSDAVKLCGMICCAGSPVDLLSNDDGVALVKTPIGALDALESEAAAFTVGEKLFTDRPYTVATMPNELNGAVFLRGSLSTPDSVECSRSGMIYFLTPLPSRNRDSQSAILESQGFQKVALPEFRLFGVSNSANNCTLYQKQCRKGDRIQFGKWAVPLFFRD